MDREVLVSVENVSKKFCRDLKKSLWYGVKAISRELVAANGQESTLRSGEFWALKDISFELRCGESLGLIGNNGAGKTTLLRLLNGLIKPDEGRISIRGRINALIALGAGFNPILTGRENIYINAAVLGLSKKAVDKIIDEIVEFAELNDFIDTPVQNYSSGMVVRLGFTIAAQLEPDILLVDEVLAVGDLAFRTKCLSHLNNLKKKGVAFILVSHNMTNIVQFTDRVIWLDEGYLKMDGKSLDVCNTFINNSNVATRNIDIFGETQTDHPNLEDAVINVYSNDSDIEVNEIVIGEYLRLKFFFRVKSKLTHPNVSFPIYNENGLLMTTIASVGRGITLHRIGNNYVGGVRFGPLNFNPGRYFIVANLHDGSEHVYRALIKHIHVITGDTRITWGLMDLNQEWFCDY